MYHYKLSILLSKYSILKMDIDISSSILTTSSFCKMIVFGVCCTHNYVILLILQKKKNTVCIKKKSMKNTRHKGVSEKSSGRSI